MPDITKRTKLEQGRAEYAYDEVRNALDNLGKEGAKEYKAYVKKMPMYIKVNGLGAALAFALYKSHKSPSWKMLYQHIEDWLRKYFKQIDEPFEEGELVGKLTREKSATYRAATMETMALLTWLRRFADGLIEGEAEQNDSR